MRRMATAILVMMALLAWQPEGTELCAQQPPSLSKHAEKMKNTIESLGVGTESRVQVELRDKTKAAGYIKSLQLDGFALFDAASASAKNIKYEEMKKVKALGGAWVQGRSTGQRPLLGKAAIGVLVVLVVVVMALVASDKS